MIIPSGWAIDSKLKSDWLMVKSPQVASLSDSMETAITPPVRRSLKGVLLSVD